MGKVRFWPLAEFILMCIVFPGIAIFGGYGHFMFFFLWTGAIYCALIHHVNFKKVRLIWRWGAVNRANLEPMLARWIVACVAIYAFTLWYDPGRLFEIWHERPELIPKLAVFYPLLSALPQEFIFCSFFFRRYVFLFGRGKTMILASAIMFAYVHMLYINPVAPVVSFLGGLIFAQTYAQTKSLALVTIEHSLYGLALFIIGLGHYFYSGAIPH